METDEHYSYIEVCPNTQDVITEKEGFGGVCPFCGDDNKMSFTHSKKVVGRVVRPSFNEWLQGKRKEFIRKEDEDKIMERLSE